MSDKPPPPKTASGEHPAVQAFRDKLESIQEHTLEAIRDLNRKLEKEIGSRPPRKDPRRDGESEPPVDIVDSDILETVTPPKKEKGP